MNSIGFNLVLGKFLRTKEAVPSMPGFNFWMNGTLKRLRADTRGVVSFEYVIVTACVVSAVGVAFNSGTTGLVQDAVLGALNRVTTAVGG
jgi:hypothetical protein